MGGTTPTNVGMVASRSSKRRGLSVEAARSCSSDGRRKAIRIGLSEASPRWAGCGAVLELKPIADGIRCDATQFAGRMPLSMDDVGVDLVSVSGRKLGGSMGVGALIGTRRSLARLAPVIHGGGHERGLRLGSLNVHGIVGFGEAAALAVEVRAEESIRLANWFQSLRGDESRCRTAPLADPIDADWRSGATATLPMAASL